MQKETIQAQCQQVIREVCQASHLNQGHLFVVGCSSSEILGKPIGTDTNLEIASYVFESINQELCARGIHLAIQCCEHLNRALIVEKKTMEIYHLEQVNAIPQPNHAGGALATITYQQMKQAVCVESLRAQADAGIDIGSTLIGMHIRPVVVPLRISLDTIGHARLTCARRRPKYVGGSRTIYDETIL